MNPNQNPQQPLDPTPPQPQVPPMSPLDSQQSAQPPTASVPGMGPILEPGKAALNKNFFSKLLASSPKMKILLVAVFLPIFAIITFVGGGSIGDVFSPKISGVQLSRAIVDEVNENESKYGFRVVSTADVSCDDGLKNSHNAVVGCTLNVKETLFGKFDEGKVTAVVRVSLPKTDTRPLDITLEDIKQAE